VAILFWERGETVMRQAIGNLVNACLMMAALLVLSAATWADPPQEPPEKGTGADEEQYRREAEKLVSGIALEMLVDGKWSEVKRIEKPLLYYGDPTRANTRGSVWAWGETGRPVALLELFQDEGNRTKWVCGLCNTSAGKLRAKRGSDSWWRENASTVELKEIPGAPAPAADAPQRQRQPKLLAPHFTAHEFWDPNNSRYELRRLERPLHSYRDENSGLLEGSLYILANGTNPEIALFIEARSQPDGKAPVWQFTIGRMSHAEIHLEYDGKEVFSGPRAGPLSGPDKPYWLTSLDAPTITEPKK
jgi:hypothetical protein